MNEDWDRVAPITFQFANIPEFQDRPLQIAQKLQEFYFEYKEINLEREANLTNLYTDSWFLHGVTQSALNMAKVMPVYTGLVFHPRKDFSILSTVGITENLGKKLWCVKYQPNSINFDFLFRRHITPGRNSVSFQFCQPSYVFTRNVCPKRG